MPVASAETACPTSVPDRSRIASRGSGIDIKAQFAELINAKPTEIAFVPNTSTGENLVVNGLGLDRNVGNVVTDALHFDGALVHLLELKATGSTCASCRPNEFRIALRDLEQAWTGTRSSSKCRTWRCTTGSSTI